VRAGDTALHLAARENNAALVAELLRGGCGALVRNRAGAMPLEETTSQQCAGLLTDAAMGRPAPPAAVAAPEEGRNNAVRGVPIGAELKAPAGKKKQLKVTLKSKPM
jgi:hypothetical protein